MPFIRFRNHHPRALLYGTVLSILKHGSPHHDIINGIAAILQLHLIREIHGGGGRTRIGQNIPGFYIIGAKRTVSSKIPFYYRDIVAFP